jgi:hypothetical protein
MYRVWIETKKGKNGPALKKEFFFDAIDTASYRDQMNEIGDFLYEQDFDFDVDEDGDMVIDDILMEISEQAEFSKSISGRGFVCTISGSSKPKENVQYNPGLEQITGI